MLRHSAGEKGASFSSVDHCVALACQTVSTRPPDVGTAARGSAFGTSLFFHQVGPAAHSVRSELSPTRKGTFRPGYERIHSLERFIRQLHVLSVHDDG